MHILFEEVRKVAEPNLAIRDRIPARLRDSETVLDAMRRLASQGKTEARDIEALAVDEKAATGPRLDAITLVSAMQQASTNVLSDLLESNDRVIVIETLKRIRDMETEWAVPELVARVKTCTDPSKRAVLAWALAAYSTNGKVQSALLEAVARDPDVEVRNHAIESLGEFRHVTVVEALLTILEHGSASERFWALYSLGTLADPRASEAIGRCLQDETAIPDFGTIAAEAEWALARINAGRRDATEPGTHGK